MFFIYQYFFYIIADISSAEYSEYFNLKISKGFRLVFSNYRKFRFKDGQCEYGPHNIIIHLQIRLKVTSLLK